MTGSVSDDFCVDDYGYGQLHTISDPYERAVVSDRISQSAMGTAENLLEARLAQHAFAALIPDEGLRVPTAETIEMDIRDGARRDLYLSAFIRGLESAFDCLAAVAIGVLRAPLSLAKAQMSQFNPAAGLVGITLDQTRALHDWQTLIDANAAQAPDGWSSWLSGMRHLFVHRARQGRVLLQRTVSPDQPKVLFVSATPERDLTGVARFDLHLRPVPGLSDMEDYVLAEDPTRLWVAEPAQVTLPGVFEAANAFIEEAAQFLLSWWRYAEKWSSSSFPVPPKAWKPATTRPDAFDGVTGATTFTPAKGMAHSTLDKRLRVANAIREAAAKP